MDATKAKAIKSEMNIEMVERTSKNGDIDSINEEKNMVIQRYENVLSLLKGVAINEDDLVHIKKPLDELESYLKNIPNGPLFNDVIPTEIKEHILSLNFPYDIDAFMGASVCEDWKMILENRFKEQKSIFICKTEEGVDAVEVLKATVAHKLDVHLVIGKPITEVDSKLVTDALTSVSKFTITNNFDYNYDVEILSDEQFEHLFQSIEKGDKIMDEMELEYLDLTRINQERLANCFVNKIKRLTLEAEPYSEEDTVVLDGKTFLTKLLQDSANLRLSHLTLISIDLFQNLDKVSCTNLVGALCKVENIKMSADLYFTSQVAKGLLKNIHGKPIVMETLIVDTDYLTDFREISSPGYLKTVFMKMATLRLDGKFTEEQLEAVRSLSDVEVEYVNNLFGESYHIIKKGSSESL